MSIFEPNYPRNANNTPNPLSAINSNVIETRRLGNGRMFPENHWRDPLPADSPLRSAPLVEGMIYKNTDSNKCIGKFAGVDSFQAEGYNAQENYKFYPYDYKKKRILHEYAINAFIKKRGGPLKHDLVVVGPGECGKENLPSPVNFSRGGRKSRTRKSRARKTRKAKKSRKHGGRRH